jgi:hypothetical protein
MPIRDLRSIHLPGRTSRVTPAPSAPSKPRQLQLLGDNDVAALRARCADDVGRRYALRRSCGRTLDLTRW